MPESDDNRTLLHFGPGPAPERGEESPTTPPGPQAIPNTREQRPKSSGGSMVQLLPGARVPATRYRIRRFIGDGGMGAVYEAEHMDLERKVALKILLPELCRSLDVTELFRHEARTASKVGSDHIVELFDFAELPDGRLMYTMELLDGPTLEQEIARAPLSPGRTIAILRQLCKGLDAAHQAGVVHRDIKPDNIVLEKVRGRPDTVKILDFGIAAIMSEGKSEQQLEAGTPGYLAPELITGVPFDRRADIYAVGCTAYQMLTGRPPFQPTGPNPVAQVLEQHLTAPPPPIAESRPGVNVPPELEAVVMKCLAKLPGNRFVDMKTLEAALCNAQIGAGLTTSFDDLPLPDGLDDDERERLLREMPDLVAIPRRSGGRWMWPLITASALAIGVGVTYVVLTEAPASEHDVQSDRIKQLVADARAAGARAHFVYPPSNEAEQPTSFAKIIELEKIDGPLADVAHAQAKDLRLEFAETLNNLGDAFWQREGGREFATEYYAQALVFNRLDEHARERSGLSNDALAELEEKAEAQSFTAEEIEQAEAVAILAEPDVEVRDRKIKALKRRRRGKKSEKLDKIVRATVPDKPGKRDAAPSPGSSKPNADTSEAQGAKDLAKVGRELLGSGKGGEAEGYFKRALTYDPSNTTALLGMYQLRFNKRAYAEAATFAQRLVSGAPGNAKHHVRLGDARFKLGRFEAARGAYAKAEELGAREAAGRLKKVAAKMNKAPKPAAKEPDPVDAFAPPALTEKKATADDEPADEGTP